jgi:quinol---cytochrome c reductase iron-sulfur subunit, bacillus type
MMSEIEGVSRRNFISIATVSIGGLIAIGMVAPAIPYIVAPALRRENTDTWILLGSTAKVEPGLPTLFKTKVERRTGWIVSEEEISAYVLTDNGRDFIVMSNICTHLGCRVRWIPEQEKFFCPCHNGVFDKEGKVISGPPPRPLDRYEVKVENNQLFVQGS